MTVLLVDDHRRLGLCADPAGARHTVETALVEPVAPGRTLLVHAGVAIASLPAEEPVTATRGAPLSAEGAAP